MSISAITRTATGRVAVRSFPAGDQLFGIAEFHRVEKAVLISVGTAEDGEKVFGTRRLVTADAAIGIGIGPTEWIEHRASRESGREK